MKALLWFLVFSCFSHFFQSFFANYMEMAFLKHLLFHIIHENNLMHFTKEIISISSILQKERSVKIDFRKEWSKIMWVLWKHRNPQEVPLCLVRGIYSHWIPGWCWFCEWRWREPCPWKRSCLGRVMRQAETWWWIEGDIWVTMCHVQSHLLWYIIYWLGQFYEA